MALGDGITWDESTPTDATTANQIDDYNRDLRKGVRNRMALEHEWPSSQSATSEAGQHKFISLQSQASVPVIGGTQLGSIYMSSGSTLMFSVGTAAGTSIVPSVASTGSVIAVSYVVATSSVACATIIPRNNSARTTTEGNQILALTHTPASNANILRVDASVNIYATANDNFCAVVFDGTAPLVTGRAICTSHVMVFVSAFITSPGTTAKAFTVNLGGEGGNRGGMNGPYDGGKCSSALVVTEIKG